MAERVLSILLRLTEDRAGNDAVLRGVERRIKAAVNSDQVARQPAATANLLTALQQRLVNQQAIIQQRAAAQASTLQQQANNAQAANAQRAVAQQATIQQRAAAAAIQQQQRAQAHQLAQQQQFIQQQALLAQRSAAQQAAIQQRFANQQAVIQQRQQQRNSNSGGFLGSVLRNASTIRESGESLQNVGYSLTSVTNRVLDFGRAAVRSATDIDQQVNVLKALTGSATAAEARFKSLVEISRRTPGLTSGLAATLDAQLRTSNVSEANIDKILPAIGKLNAVAPLGNPQAFASNLIQLITQNFERADLKELVGNSPLAGQLVAQIFNVDNPTNSKAIRESAKRLGIDTTDEFFAAFADAAAKNTKLANVSESLATRFDKLRDRVSVALRPVGVSVIESLTPLVERVIPIIERAAEAFGDLPQSTRETAVGLGLLTVAAGPATIALGSVVQSVGALGNLAGVVGGAAGLGGVGVSLTTLSVLVAGAAVEAKSLYDAYQTNLLGIRTTVATFIAEATAFWAEYGDDIKGLTVTAWEFIQRNIVTRVSSVLKIVNGVLQIINGDWRKGLGSLTTGAVEAVRGLPGTMLNIGHQAAAGLARGLVERGKDVANAATAMVRAALQASTLTLGIQSPSREFFKIGQQVGDGFILGVRAKQPDVFGFLNQTFNQATVLAQQAVGRLAAQYATIDSLSTNFRNAARRGDFVSELRGRRVNDVAGELRQLAKPTSPKPSAAVPPTLLDNLRNGTKGAGQPSESQRLQDELRDVNKEVALLRAATSPEYKLKIKLDAAQETRTELENLLSLRRELGQVVGRPITDVKGETARLQALKEANRLSAEQAANPFALVAAAKRTELDSEGRNYERLNSLIAQGESKLTELTREQVLVRTDEYEALRKTNPLLAEHYRTKAAGQDTEKAVNERQKTFLDLQVELQGQLQRTQDLSAVETLQARLKAKAYAELTDVQREELLLLARQKDAYDTQQESLALQKTAIENARRSYEQFTDSLQGIFSDAFERGPKAFFDAALSYGKRTLARILAEIAAANIARALSSAGSTNGNVNGGTSQGGGQLNNVLNIFRPQASGFGGFNLGGIGPGGTGTFTGAPINLGGGTTSASGAGGVGGFRGLINQVAGFNIFGTRAASAITAPVPTGSGVLPTISAAQAGIPTTLSTETALAKAAGVKATSASAFGALGATGLLAGGGLLGSLAGGQSQTGRLLGGLGGTLGAGFIGASGLLGGSAAAGTGIAGGFGALAPLLANPITAVIAGALVGTALLVRAFANRDLKKLAATIKDVHQLNVPVKGEGLVLLKEIKKIGEEQYGKRWLDQRVDLVKQQNVVDILTQYAVGTNQTNSALYRNKQLADPFSEANNFVRRLNGGPIFGPTLGRDHIPALLDGNEYVSSARAVSREGIARFTALEAGLATIKPVNDTAGLQAEIAAMRADFRAGVAAIVAGQNEVAQHTARLGLATFGQVVVTGLAEEPQALDRALSTSLRGGHLYDFAENFNT